MSKRIAHTGGQQYRRIFLREWREYRNLTQEQLADRLETTAATISRIETGNRDYTGAFLEAAADALQCELKDLLMRNPLLEEEDPADMLRSLPPDDRRQAIDFLHYLRDRKAG